MTSRAVGTGPQRQQGTAPRTAGHVAPHAGSQAELQRVVLAAGGTAGHLYPGVAVAEAIRRRWPHCQILFVGTPRGIERRVLPRLGYPLRMIRAAPYYGVGALSRLAGVLDMSVGVFQARALVAELRPNVVMGFGGFTSVAPVAAAASLGVPTAIHESNVAPGMATSLLARLADDVYLGVPECARHFHRATSFTGNPVRAEIAALSSVRRLPRRDGTVRILVTTGSMGENFLNRNMPQLSAVLQSRGYLVEVWQQAGGEATFVRDHYARSGVRARVEDFIADMPAALRWADLVISRSGASILAEIAAASLPAVIVPLVGHARNHQADNAEAYTRTGAGWFVPEHSWQSERVAELVIDRIDDPQGVLHASRHARDLSHPNAAADVVERLATLAASRAASESAAAQRG